MTPLHELYRSMSNNLARYEIEKQNSEPNEIDAEIDEILQGWKEAIYHIDQSRPDIKAWYTRNTSLQNSFTSDQINFICEQIGDWYLMMKPLLEGQHNLGYMKEKLKIMICGE